MAAINKAKYLANISADMEYGNEQLRTRGQPVDAEHAVFMRRSTKPDMPGASAAVGALRRV